MLDGSRPALATWAEGAQTARSSGVAVQRGRGRGETPSRLADAVTEPIPAVGPDGEPVRDRARAIPEAAVARLAVYLRVLSGMAEQGVGTVSSEELSAAAGVNSAKLRKDLSYVGSY
ncbi:MAG TPA: winged-helix domain-containing protein, partial [Pseudonocardiaceae bacterium]